MAIYCGYCEKDLTRIEGLRVDAKFCSKECHLTYWRKKRKMQRQYERASQAIVNLATMLYNDNPLLGDAAIRLNDLAAMASASTAKLKWKCGNDDCGQTVYIRPHKGQRCYFCGESNWLMAKTIGTKS